MIKFDSAKFAAHASILFVLCLALYMYITKDERAAKLNHKIAMLQESCDFAIGTSTGTSGYKGGAIQAYTFYFMYKNKLYQTGQNPSENHALIPDFSEVGYIRDKQYLVLVDKSKPQRSKICFDKPIKDSVDYKRYVEEFIQDRNR